MKKLEIKSIKFNVLLYKFPCCGFVLLCFYFFMFDLHIFLSVLQMCVSGFSCCCFVLLHCEVNLFDIGIVTNNFSIIFIPRHYMKATDISSQSSFVQIVPFKHLQKTRE